MIRVLLAEDVTMVRGALAALIRIEDDLEVVAETGRGDDVAGLAAVCRPDVAVLDLNLPGLNGVDAATALRKRVPHCGVVILTGMVQAGLLDRAIAAGVSGYLLKTASPTELPDAIRSVAEGRTVFDPNVVRSTFTAGISPLTSREHDVLVHTARGSDPREIATTLGISVSTVRNHLTSVVAKLNAKNRVDALRLARSSGLLLEGTHAGGEPS